MPNALNRKLREGEVVIVASRYVAGGTRPQRDREFRVSHGPGTYYPGDGSAIYGTWLASGREDMIQGHMIDPAATATHQSTSTGGMLL